MAKKKNENVILENVELKPQVLGYTFQKKNNIGRVIFIFIAFILVVYYIDDISVFFNNLLQLVVMLIMVIKIKKRKKRIKKKMNIIHFQMI